MGFEPTISGFLRWSLRDNQFIDDYKGYKYFWLMEKMIKPSFDFQEIF